MRVELSKIPTELFRPVVQIRDLRSAHIANKSEKKNLRLHAKDVILKSPLGISEVVSREEIRAKYRYTDGRKVVLHGTKAGEVFVVVANTQANAFALPVRGNTQVIMPNGAIANKAGNKSLYIICYPNANNEPDKTSPFLIGDTYFKKMFKSVPGYRVGKQIKKKPQRNIKQTSVKPQAVQTKQKEQPPQKQVTKSLKAVAQLVRNGVVVGYMLQDSAGHKKNFDLKQIAYLAKQQRIVNLGYRVPVDKKPYLFGIGIQLNNLPKVAV